MRQTWSRYPVREIGWASDGEVLLTEEDRESHIHILGAPSEGKSKFLELLVRQDIDRGYGCCLLDPSDNGDTAYNILKYCIKKGYEKVLLIDPHDVRKFDKIPTINPLHYKAPAGVSAANVMDTIRILWGTKSFDETPRIQHYLPAILRALHAAQLTLHEALYFTDKTHPEYKRRRANILDSLHPLHKDRVTLESAFGLAPHTFNMEFASTVRRLNPLFEDVMKLMLGSSASPLNFTKMIAEGWVILINLDPQGVWQTEQQRLLGTLVINEIIYAMHRLRTNGWNGVYYLYIDEVGDYATPKLAEILDKRRKSGLRFTIAHQRFDQIQDENVLSSVKGSTKIKVLFNTPNRRDRDEMLRMMYGGDLSDRQVSYELSLLQRQFASIRINKNPPRVTRLPDLPTVKVTPKEIDDFKRRVYAHECYRSRREILDEINARFKESKRSVHPKQSGESGVNQRPKRGRKKVAVSPAQDDNGTNRETGPGTTQRRPVKSVFSEEQD